MRKTFLLFVVAVVFSTCAIAQGRVGSPYTRYGIGDINNSSLTRNNAMGGLSYTLPYSDNINFINPACVSEIDSLTFIFDFGINGGARLYSIENPPLDQVKTDFQLSHLIFGFPVTKWWGAALGVLPFSNVGYSIKANDSLLNVSKDYLFVGDGGINKVFWSNSFKPFKNFKIGVNASYLFGKMYQTNAIDFDDDSGAYLNVLEQNMIRVSDFTFDFGLNYQFKLNKNNKLCLGAIYGLASDLNSFRSTMVFNTLSTGSSSIVDTIYNPGTQQGIISLPTKIGFGLGYQYSDKFYVGLDYSFQDWTNAQFFGNVDSLGNSSFLSIGAELIPVGRKGNYFKYWQGVSYRFGGHFNNTYFQLYDDQPQINDFGISFGLGLPMKRSKTSFNISMELGQRGTLSNNLVKENYAILGISFTLSDMWFVKSKFD